MPRWAFTLMALLTACMLAFAAAWWQTQRSGPAATPAAASPSPPDIAAPVVSGALSGSVQTPPARLEPDRSEPVPESSRAAPANTIERRAVDTPNVREAAPIRPVGAAQPISESPPPPSLAQLRASGVDVPALELQLHSFSDSRARRFVFVNGARYGEGETLAAGPRVVRITPNGVVLDQNGREFLLTVD